MLKKTVAAATTSIDYLLYHNNGHEMDSTFVDKEPIKDIERCYLAAGDKMFSQSLFYILTPSGELISNL